MRSGRWLAASLALVVTGLTLVGTAASAGSAVSDPLRTGTHPVAATQYSLGDTAYHISEFPGPVELTGEVFYPTDLRGGPYPIVLLLHGRHETCMNQHDVTGDWPCPKGFTPIPSYRGYDYLARPLASHGYAVISISANGINAADGTDYDNGMDARGRLVLKHLDLWHDWHSNMAGSPIAVRYLREFDFSRIGLMGHSRGGEGIVAALELNQTRSKPYAIKALLPLAPTDFDRRIPVNVPVGTLLPTCDGDVSDLEGVHYYDDARYRLSTDMGQRNVITVQGANHNFFNTAWSPSSKYPGARDDWDFDRKTSACSPTHRTRLTETQQRRVASAYIGSYFRYYLGGERVFEPLWRGDAAPPASVAPARVQVTYEAPSYTHRRLDINRFDYDPQWDYLGGAVHATGILFPCGGPEPTTDGSCLSRRDIDPVREPERGFGYLGVSAMTMTWKKPATISNSIPAKYGDVRAYRVVELRAAVDFTSVLNPLGKPQELNIAITDRQGRTASVPTSEFSTALDYPATSAGFDVIPHMLFNPIRVPLSAFHGVDLKQVQSVTLRFGATPHGRLALADLAFSN